METTDYIKMDYSLTTNEERIQKVNEIIANTPSERLTPKYLEKLAEYLTDPTTKEEKKKKEILTNNRMVTINKRETSFEGLVNKLENGEDGIYNLITNDKNILFQPKKPITKSDVEEIPALQELQSAIKQVKQEISNSRGKKAYRLGKQLVEMYKDQYEIKKAYKPAIYSRNTIKSAAKLDLTEHIWIDEATGQPRSDGLVTFLNPEHISFLLCNYSKLKEECWDNVQSDMRWLMEDLDDLVDRTLKDKYPIYYDIIIYKIDGYQNIQIQQLLLKDYNETHSIEYISSLWKKKIPKMLAEAAVNEYLVWYYTEKERGKWKKCSKCGQIKLAHNNFFSKNKTSKDGWYSICKECRNKKPPQQKKVTKE